MSNKKGVYKFCWDSGRGGNVESIFIATDDEVESIIGKEVWFGEILGKHSEVYGTIEPGEIVLITDDPQAIRMFEVYNFSIGYNPFDYLPEE